MTRDFDQKISESNTKIDLMILDAYRKNTLEENINFKGAESERGKLKRLQVIEEQETKSILRNPNLFIIICSEINKKVVHEEKTIQTIFLCSCGRLVLNAKKTSYNLMINDESGCGKDWVTSKTLEIIPQDYYCHRTRITEKVLTYWHNPKFEPDWTWDGKVFYNEDISNVVLNSEVFKVFASSGSKATVLVDQMPIDIEIKGKPVLIITCADVSPSKELLRRFTICPLDSSIDQTKAIIKRQAEAAATGKTLEYNLQIVDCQRDLRPVKVKIPYSEIIIPFFPTAHIVMRTHFERFLDYIKASAALHQYQREKDAEGFILATGQDYDIARIALIKTTSNKEMIPLTKDERQLISLFENKLDNNKAYSVKEIEPHIPSITQKSLYTKVKKLAEYGFLKADIEKIENSKKPVQIYSFVSFLNMNIPKYEELQNITNVSNKENDTINTNVSNDNQITTKCRSIESFESIVMNFKTSEINSLENLKTIIINNNNKLHIEKAIFFGFTYKQIDSWKMQGAITEFEAGFLSVI